MQVQHVATPKCVRLCPQTNIKLHAPDAYARYARYVPQQLFQDHDRLGQSSAVYRTNCKTMFGPCSLYGDPGHVNVGSMYVHMGSELSNNAHDALGARSHVSTR